MIVLEHPRHRSGHERLAQPYNVANHDAAPPVKVMRSDLDGSRLELEELVAEIPWYAKFGQTGSCFLR